MEPMLSGHLILASIFEVLCYLNDTFPKSRIPEPTLKAFAALLLDWKVRAKAYEEMNICKITDLNDKWLFSGSRLIEIGRKIGYEQCIIKDLGMDARFSSKIKEYLSLIGDSYDNIPEWGRRIIKTFDDNDVCDDNDINFYSLVIYMK
jgi:hypothetical protein